MNGGGPSPTPPPALRAIPANNGEGVYINDQQTDALCTFNRPAVWDEIVDLLSFVVIRDASDSGRRTINSCHVTTVDDHYVLRDAHGNNLGRVALRNNNTVLVIVPSGHLDTVILGATLLTDENPYVFPEDDTYTQLPMFFRAVGSSSTVSIILRVENDGDNDYIVSLLTIGGDPWNVNEGQLYSDDLTLAALPVSPGEQAISAQDLQMIMNFVFSIYHPDGGVNVTLEDENLENVPASVWNLFTGEVS